MNTLVIHPADRSTDFLKPIYETIPVKTVVTGGITVEEVNELIKTHDRVIMLGHGCPDGLFACHRFTNAYGFVINSDTVELLKEKKDNVYIWCHANEFVEKHELQGFYSGMFISELGEADFEFQHYKTTMKEVTDSNDAFAHIFSKYINEPSAVIQEKVTKEYGVLGETNPVARYNNEKLQVL